MHSSPVAKDIVLIGGGHAHVQVLKAFGMRPMPGVRLTVVSRDIETPYSGMLPGQIAGFYAFEETHIDLRPIARMAEARLLQDEVTGIDTAAQRIVMRGHPPLAYDVVSIDIGSRPSFHGIPGAEEHAVPVKPITGLSAAWERILADVREGHGPQRFVTVGVGAAGVEVTLAARHKLREMLAAQGRDPDALTFTMLGRGELLADHNASVRRRFHRILAEQGVRLVTGVTIGRVSADAVVCGDGTAHPCDAVLWVTDAGAASWLADTGLALDERGFVAVDETLRSLSHGNIFAAGDIAAMRGQDLAKAGVYAVRQGPPLTENLRRAVEGQPLVAYRPQRDFLSLITTGGKGAVASRGRWAAEGPLMWRWKDWIDRRFMRMFQELPEMGGEAPATGAVRAVSADLAAEPMRCGGCGAKVGRDALRRVLERLAPEASPSLAIGLDAPDDAAVLVPPPGKLLVQTVDFFRAFVSDPYLFGRIAANHALGDIYAMGGEPLTALAVATVPHAAEDKIEEDLFQILRGGLDVLQAAGCVLAGGHTAEGAELALGFTINGGVDAARILRKGGAREGDRLVLTKPLGTGTLMAAEMRGKGRARAIAGALACMQISNAEAARIIVAHGATAATDVTGFGLAGHLHEMLTASRLDATLDLAKVGALDGALEALAAGIASSLAPDNLRLRRAFDVDEVAARDPRFALLFDPQTAGGLLAAIPAEKAHACAAALRAAGYPDAAVVGTLTAPLVDGGRMRLGVS